MNKQYVGNSLDKNSFNTRNVKRKKNIFFRPSHLIAIFGDKLAEKLPDDL